MFINIAVAVTTLLLAIATWKMAKVTQKTLDAQSQPCVIVYAELDKEHPEIINLVIENIGTAPASNIRFELPEYFPWGADGLVPGSKEKPRNLLKGPLRNGMKFLVPGAPWRTYWGQYGGLMDGLGGKPVEITVHFSFADGRPAESTKNILHIPDFETRVWVDSYTKKQTDALEKQVKSLASISDSIRRYSAKK